MNIVVTGTSAGIGRALADHLLGSGHRVWGLARSAQAGRGPRFQPVACDVSRWDEVARAAAGIGAGLDGLVCCAGWQGEIGRAVAADPLRWSETVRANLEGTYFPIRAFFPLLAQARRAKIVCFSGGGATRARPNFSAYGAAKTAVVRLVETIAAEEAGRLDINAVAPGAVATRMTEEVLRLGPAVAGPAEYAAAQELTAKGAKPDRALALVEWLLSPASDGISGKLISALWDPWEKWAEQKASLAAGDKLTLRRIDP